MRSCLYEQTTCFSLRTTNTTFKALIISRTSNSTTKRILFLVCNSDHSYINQTLSQLNLPRRQSNSKKNQTIPIHLLIKHHQVDSFFLIFLSGNTYSL